jgi:hypothetical protein
MNMLLILARADWTVFVFRLFAPDLREEELHQVRPFPSNLNSELLPDSNFKRQKFCHLDSNI